MDTQKRSKIEAYLRQQMNNIDSIIERYTLDRSGNPHPKRDLFERVQSYVNDFLEGNDAHSWCVLTGLRGVGKTTLLMQILSSIPSGRGDILFLSVDRIVKLFNVSLFDVLQVYEDMVGESFEIRKRSLFLFVDEAQYDKDWGIALKDVYDRGKKNVFMLVTGSAALALTENNDIVRRSTPLHMLPMSFVEYVNLQKGIRIPDDVREQVRSALFASKNAKEMYERLVFLEPSIKKCLADVGPHQMKQYIEAGSLPSVLFMRRGEVFSSCNRSIARIINEDIVCAFNFADDTIKKASMLLYILASSDQVSYGSVGNRVDLNRSTVKGLLDAFVSAGMLIHVSGHTASHSAQMRQRSKFLFLAPAFRSAIFDDGGSVLPPEAMYAKLVEDAVGLVLHGTLRSKDEQTSSLTFDAREGGADFVVSVGERKIVLEVGIGKKGSRQVKQTAKRVQPVYSIVVSDAGTLSFDEENACVKVPLEYFLLA